MIAAVTVIAANVEPWQGMTAVAVLAAVVAYLFKWADGRVTKSETDRAALELAHTEELNKRDLREEKLKTELEARIAAQAIGYAQALKQEHSDNRAHEDALRKEFTSIVSTISDQTSKSAESLTEVLGKLHDRFSGNRPRT